MRFISKNSNLRIILKPGLPASPLTGTMAIPTVFVKFQDGEAYVENEDLIAAMKSHIGFNTDFIAVDEGAKDPFAHTRSEIEPAHHITEMKYGHADGTKSTPKKIVYTPEMQAAIQAEAMKMMQEMLPGAIANVLSQAKENIAVDKAREDSKAARDFNAEAELLPTPGENSSAADLETTTTIKPQATRGRKPKAQS